MSQLAGLQDSREQGSPADIGTFEMPTSVLVYKHVFSGVTYTVAVRSGERGWILVDHGFDATVILQAAFTSLAAVGGTIYVMPETYIIPGVVQGVSNVDLVGDGKTTILKATAGLDVPILWFNGKEHFAIRNIQFHGNQANQTAGVQTNGSVYFSSCNDVEVRDCYFYDHKDAGVNLNICLRVTVLGCNFDHYGFSQAAPLTDSFAIECITSSYCVFAANTIKEGQGVSPRTSIGIGNGSASSHNVISSNTIQNCTGNGIDCNSVTEYVVANNTVEHCYSLFLGHGSKRSLITGNVVTNCTITTAANGNGALWIFDGIGDNSEEISVIGNVSMNNLGPGAALMRVQNVLFANNNIYGNIEDGLMVHTSTNIHVVDNKIEYNGQPAGWVAGINLWESDYVTVEDNNVQSNRANGIYIDATGNMDHILVYCNYFFNNVAYGLFINSAFIRYCDVRYNSFHANLTGPLTDNGLATTLIYNAGYNPRGNIATPYSVAAGNLSDVAGAQAFPTTAVNYTVTGSPKLITIYGGTITSVSIGGVATGQTGAATFAAYRLEPGQILNVVWTAQPSSVVYAE